MEIWVDINKEGKVHNKTIEFLKNYKWSKGLTRFHVQKKHAGLYGQWINSWRSRKYSEYQKDFDSRLKEELALILEDDMVVSPFAYRYLRMVHQKYQNRNDFAGFSLNTGDQFFFHNKVDTPFPMGKNVFLYLSIGTWGFSPSPFVWSDFQDWFHNLLKKGMIPFIKKLHFCPKNSTSCFTSGFNKPLSYHPYVPDSHPSKWYKDFEKIGKEDSMWEMWFIHFCHLHSKHTLMYNLNSLFNNTQEIYKFLFYTTNPPRLKTTTTKFHIKKSSPMFLISPKQRKKNSTSKPLTPMSQRNDLDFNLQSKLIPPSSIFFLSPNFYLALAINRQQKGLHFSGSSFSSNCVLISKWNKLFNYLPDRLSHYNWDGNFMYEN